MSDRAEATPLIDAFAAGVDAHPATVMVDLEHLADLLMRWSQVKNLVSRETLNHIWMRHFADSLQLLPYFPSKTSTILDLGSGGGFPALPLAVALKARGDELHLVESVGRKGAFLREVGRQLGLNIKVHTARAEALAPQVLPAIDVVTARAFAPLDRLMAYAQPFWQAETLGLFHKGEEHVEEVQKASQFWQFDVLKEGSRVHALGVILKIRNIQPIAG